MKLYNMQIICIKNIYLKLYLLANDYYTEWVKSFAIFWCKLVYGLHIMWPKQLKALNVSTLVGSFVVVGAVTCSALLHTVYDVKAAQIKV